MKYLLFCRLFLFHHSSFSFAFFLLFFSLLSSFLSMFLFSLQWLPILISLWDCSHTSFLSLNFFSISYSVSFPASVSPGSQTAALSLGSQTATVPCSLPHAAAERSVTCRESYLPWTRWVTFFVYRTLHTWSWQCWKNSCLFSSCFWLWLALRLQLFSNAELLSAWFR